jgi:hypothetical protein
MNMAGVLSLNLEPIAAASPEPNEYVRSIFEREMGVTLHNLKAGSPRDEAMRNLTKEVTNFYAKRVLRELIQNAFDGAARAEEPRIMLRLDLRSGRQGTLYIANNGNGFTKDNVDAVVSPAMSNKTPGNFIGHKGLGFRSVELLSDDVQIFSMQDTGAIGADRFDGFGFRFAHPEDEEGWLRARGEGRYAADVVGRVHRLQLPVPILYPDPDTAQFAGEGYATLIRLPLRDDTAGEQAADEMRLLFDEKAPITLFLDRLSSLTIERVDPKFSGVKAAIALCVISDAGPRYYSGWREIRATRPTAAIGEINSAIQQRRSNNKQRSTEKRQQRSKVQMSLAKPS